MKTGIILTLIFALSAFIFLRGDSHTQVIDKELLAFGFLKKGKAITSWIIRKKGMTAYSNKAKLIESKEKLEMVWNLPVIN